ncbi:MAG: RimK family protein [Legionellaceae bacterium]|nr:RimK family protein [Legionellaceae bacterium]MBP9774938.1 RimK family protein [Legionellaceae bacterium]
MQTIVVTDDAPYWDFLNEFPIIQAEDYLKGSPYQTKSIRVINLCQSYEYQTIGYYVSLLAMAQDQKVSPSIQTTQDCTHAELSKQFLGEVDEDIQKSLSTIKEDTLTFNIYFGECFQTDFAPLAKSIYDRLPMPLLTLNLTKKNSVWSINKISILASQDIPGKEKAFMHQMAQKYLNKKRFYSGSNKKQPFFHLAILTDPEEGYCAPSDEKALEKFAEAGDSLGIQVDFIDKNDIKILPEYAGLFIRTSPAANHYTYQFSRRAAQENLVVIDDPQSIVKCRNKVYQAVAFQNHQLKTPHTMIVSKYQSMNISVPFPCVIKRPDSGYSKDVLKADNEKELKKALNQFFKFSDLVIIQSFLPTDFDWRISILDRKPLYALRYYMAKDHWQIINWASTSSTTREGNIEAVSLKEVPEDVIQTALDASSLIGDGLYGVDIKSRDNEHYVIEVNGNLSIDHDFEGKLLSDNLYRQIMTVFLERMQAKHGLLHAKPYYEQPIIEHDNI